MANNYKFKGVALATVSETALLTAASTETIIIKSDGSISNYDYCGMINYNPCIFEYVYLARPDSTMDNINVYNSRLSMGKYLAKKIKKVLSKKELNEIDTVIPIPDTSRTSALPISIELNKELREGFVKNRYIGRTFIMPGQKIRKKSVKHKLNTISSVFKNKNPNFTNSNSNWCPGFNSDTSQLIVVKT